ncbi:MAG: PQQ-binding-like beta-propeller repeat protein [Planctomycetota bacterium]
MNARTIPLALAVLAASFFGSGLSTADAQSLELPAPENWRGEKIDLPPGFARDMSFFGIESIRFAPGMFRPAAKDFFSYVLVFRLDRPKSLSRDTLKDEILKYYRGLAKSVSNGQIDPSGFRLKLETRKRNAKFPAAVSSALGTLEWVEPFRTKKKQTLRLEFQYWKSEKTGRIFLFTCASPQKTDQKIWTDLHRVRDRYLATATDAISAIPSHWPSFRGSGASGQASGPPTVTTWDLATKKNVLWQIDVPGLAHSSPIVWENKIFVTTAVSSKKGASFKPGLYGSGEASADRTSQRWEIQSYDKRNGKLIWKKTATEGKPKDKRHIKATYANSTPATDGEIIVAAFGSEGLFAYSTEGEKLWKAELGRLDVGAYDAPGYEWGTASSPIIFRDKVIVQCDTQGDSFLLAVDRKTGKTAWKTPRDELPSWGTPTICPGPNGPELVTNGSNFIRGYDPQTGKEFWRLGGSSKITAPTPICSDGLIVVASGRAPERPIFAIRAGSRGDLSLEKGKRSSDAVAWSHVRRGPYMPTPLIKAGLLYVLGNSGNFDVYDVKTGEEVYRKRIRHAGSGFSASPIASGEHIYVPSEDGDVFIVRAGRSYELVGKSSVNDRIMATPAISDGVLFIRSQKRLYAIGTP